MCKFYASTTFPSIFYFHQKSAFQNVDYCQSLSLKASQVLHMGYMIYFYYQDGCYNMYLGKNS